MTETKQKILNEIIQNWYGKEGDINSVSIHYLICALDQVRCDLLNKYEDGDGEIYLTIKQTLTNKLLDLVQHTEKYPLQEGLGTIYQIYLLVEPNIPNNMYRLFVISKREDKYAEKGYDYCLGVDYMPESGNWGHGHYDAASPEVWEEYIKERHGKAIPLL